METESSVLHTATDFLPYSLINELREFSKANQITGVNLTTWGPELVNTSGPILLYSLGGELLNRISNIVEKTTGVAIEGERAGATYTLGSRYSYLPWHDDAVYSKLTMTVYLNERWDLDWGGAFIYKCGAEFKAIYPEFNKAVWFKPPLRHGTVMSNIQAPMRESLQIFVG